MRVKIGKSTLRGEIEAIPSKSYIHRTLIMASRASEPTVIRGMIKSQDVLATIACITAIGASVEWLNEVDCKVTPIVTTVQKSELNASESGSTLRFILPQLGVLGMDAVVTCEGRLPSRTNEELFKAMTEHGISVDSGNPICIHGQLTCGEYSIRGNISSQYISGLLMALCTLSGDSIIHVLGELESEPYIAITLEVMSQFGVKILKTGTTYFIRGGQTINTVSREIIIEGDWSNASPWLVVGAATGDIAVSGLNQFSRQGDRVMLELLGKMGLKYEWESGKLILRQSNLKAIGCSVKDCPDITPLLALAMSVSSGKSVIHDVERLKFKESDRQAAIADALGSFGIEIECGDSIIITGGKLIGGKVISSHSDHRIAMLAAVAGCLSERGIEIENAEAINKSYPMFYNELIRLGGNVNVRE